MTEINTSNIPEELKSESFMLWRLEQREGRQTKPPINPSSGFRGNVQDPKQWTDFDNALRIHEGGRFHTNGVSVVLHPCLLYTSPSPRDVEESRMPSSA